MHRFPKFIQEHWLPVLLLTALAVAAAISAIWQVFTHDTIPEVISKKGLSVTWSVNWLIVYRSVVLVAAIGLIALLLWLIGLVLRGEPRELVRRGGKEDPIEYEVTPVAEIEGLKSAIEALQAEREGIRTTLQAEIEAGVQERARLQKLLDNKRIGLEQAQVEIARLNLAIVGYRLERQPKKISATVRFIDYDDHVYADHIQGLFRTYLRLPTEVKRDDGSHLRPIGERITFESGTPELIRELAIIFNQGNLLKEVVRPLEIVDSASEDVIVTIYPRPKS